MDNLFLFYTVVSFAVVNFNIGAGKTETLKRRSSTTNTTDCIERSGTVTAYGSRQSKTNGNITAVESFPGNTFSNHNSEFFERHTCLGGWKICLQNATVEGCCFPNRTCCGLGCCRSGYHCCQDMNIGHRCCEYGYNCCPGTQYCCPFDTDCCGHVCCTFGSACIDNSCVRYDDDDYNFSTTPEKKFHLEWYYILAICFIVGALMSVLACWCRMKGYYKWIKIGDNNRVLVHNDYNVNNDNEYRCQPQQMAISSGRTQPIGLTEVNDDGEMRENDDRVLDNNDNTENRCQQEQIAVTESNKNRREPQQIAITQWCVDNSGRAQPVAVQEVTEVIYEYA